MFRNLGTVDKWGIDGSVAWSPIKQLTLYAFGSWMDSKIKDNIQIGSFWRAITESATTSRPVPLRPTSSGAAPSPSGNRESGAPKYTYGFSALGTLGPVDLGITAKRTGPRYIFDNNARVFRLASTLPIVNDANAATIRQVVFDSTAPAYWLVNLDARLNLQVRRPQGDLLPAERLQPVRQVLRRRFRRRPVAGAQLGCNTQYGNPPFVQIGAPRTVSPARSAFRSKDPAQRRSDAASSPRGRRRFLLLTVRGRDLIPVLAQAGMM